MIKNHAPYIYKYFCSEYEIQLQFLDMKRIWAKVI